MPANQIASPGLPIYNLMKLFDRLNLLFRKSSATVFKLTGSVFAISEALRQAQRDNRMKVIPEFRPYSKSLSWHKDPFERKEKDFSCIIQRRDNEELNQRNLFAIATSFLSKSLIITLIISICSIHISTAQTSNKEDLEKKKEQLVNEIADMQKELDKTKKTKNVNLNQLAALRKQINTREKLIGTYNSQINQIDKEITSKVRVVRSLGRDLDTLKKNYAHMVYYAYKHRSAYDKLLFLFSASDFNDAFLRLKYIKRYSAYRRMQVQLIQTTQTDIKKQMGQLRSQRENKKHVLTEQQQQKQKLALEKAEKDKMVKTLSKQEKLIKADLDKKKKEQALLKKEIADLIRKEIEESKKKANASNTKSNSSSSSSLTMTPEAAALSASFASNQGKLPWPVSKGDIIENFGEHEHPVLSNVKTKNNGIDIKTNQGADVRAVFKGTVVSIISNPGYHKAVLIKHGEYFTVYSNLSSVKVKANQEIDTKQSIGTAYSDESGDTSVHLEIWKGTILLDPENWIIAK